MIVLDTSILVDGLTGQRRSAPAVRIALLEGEQIRLPALVLYEWLRGPRLAEELAVQQALFPMHSVIPFGVEEATASSHLYRSVRRARSREIDLAIAACAIVHEAQLWTLNPAAFRDIPGLHLYQAG